jgi:hypothetical protein
METRTVKPLKALPNMLRKVMPRIVVATKLSQGKKDLGNLKYITQHSTKVQVSTVVPNLNTLIYIYHIIHVRRELHINLTVTPHCQAVLPVDPPFTIK